MADRTLGVRVVSPEKVVYEGRASSLVAPAWDGQVGILPGHAPFLALLGSGELTVDLPAGGSEIPTFLSYLTEKRLSKNPEEFGNGAIEGVIEEAEKLEKEG